MTDLLRREIMKKPKEEEKRNPNGRRKKYCRPVLRTGELFQRALVDCGKTTAHPCASVEIS